MRFTRLYPLSITLLAAPLAAQGFEGTIAMKVSGDEPQMINWNIKGALKSGSKVSADGTPGASLIIDNNAKTATTLMPMPAGVAMGGMAGFAVTSQLRAPTAANAKVGPRKLGTSENISGFQCDDYDLNDAEHTHACLASDLGAFAYPGSGSAMAGGGGGGGGTFMAGSGLIDSLTSQLNGGALPPGARVVTFGGDGNGPVGRIITMTNDQGAGGGGGGGGAMTRVAVGKANADGSPGVMTVMTKNPDGTVTTTVDSNWVRPTAATSVSGMMGGGGGGVARVAGPSTPAWANALRGAAFPVRVWKADGTTLLEITDVRREGVSDNLFAIPEGYQQAGNGGGGAVMRRGGGR